MSSAFSNVQEINLELENLEKKLSSVTGRPTEVYTRIVGYHRDVSNWNKGKKEEYYDRKTFDVDNGSLDSKKSALVKEVSTSEVVKSVDFSKKASYYKFFFTNRCINCPPVKEYMKNITLDGESIDASLDLGLNEAKKYDVMSTPTVILFDENDEIIFTAHNKNELEKFFS